MGIPYFYLRVNTTKQWETQKKKAVQITLERNASKKQIPLNFKQEPAKCYLHQRKENTSHPSSFTAESEALISTLGNGASQSRGGWKENFTSS